MATPDVIAQARELILSAQPEDLGARKAALTLLNENDLLIGRVRAKKPFEDVVRATVATIINDERLDPTTRINFTALPRAVLLDKTLMAERLNLIASELPKAREVFAAMAADLKGE